MLSCVLGTVLITLLAAAPVAQAADANPWILVPSQNVGTGANAFLDLAFEAS